MRLLHIALVLAGIFLFSSTQGQSVKSSSQTDSIKADSLAKVANDSIKWAKMFQSIDNLKTQLTPKGDSSLRIGQFILFQTNRIPTYKVENKPKTPDLQKDKKCDCPPNSGDCACREKTPKIIQIKKVSFLLKEGTIIDIQVFTSDNKTFSNNGKPIEISKFNERCDLLKMYSGMEELHIQTCDFLQWERQSTALPPNSYFILDSVRNERTLFRELGATTQLEMRLSTDLLGAFGNTPNGLFQAEATLTQTLNSNNVKNKGLFYFNFMKFNFNLSKFDSRFRVTPVDTGFYRMLLFQRSWLNGDVTFNIFKTWITQKSEGAFYVNAGGGFGLTEILPSNKVQSSSIMPYFFVEPGLDVRFSSNFSLDMTARFISHFAPQIESSEFSGNRFILRPQLSVHWYPLSTAQSRMFTRLTYNQDLSDNKLFVQVQFGYTLILGDGLRKN